MHQIKQTQDMHIEREIYSVQHTTNKPSLTKLTYNRCGWIYLKLSYSLCLFCFCRSSLAEYQKDSRNIKRVKDSSKNILIFCCCLHTVWHIWFIYMCANLFSASLDIYFFLVLVLQLQGFACWSTRGWTWSRFWTSYLKPSTTSPRLMSTSTPTPWVIWTMLQIIGI